MIENLCGILEAVQLFSDVSLTSLHFKPGNNLLVDFETFMYTLTFNIRPPPPQQQPELTLIEQYKQYITFLPRFVCPSSTLFFLSLCLYIKFLFSILSTFKFLSCLSIHMFSIISSLSLSLSRSLSLSLSLSLIKCIFILSWQLSLPFLLLFLSISSDPQSGMPNLHVSHLTCC